jgi:hypothetical protein
MVLAVLTWTMTQSLRTTQHSRCWYFVLRSVVDLYVPWLAVAFFYNYQGNGDLGSVPEEDQICFRGSILHAHVKSREY